MRKLYSAFLLAFTFFIFSKANSQINYSFSASTGTYTPISGTSPTLISSGIQGAEAPDEGYANNIPIGFTLNYNGANYTAVNISSNGFIALGAPFATPGNGYYNNNLSTGPTGATGSPSLTGVRPIIAPLWDDLDMVAETNISYAISGTAPSRVFTVQYANAKWDWNAAGPVISFQIKLFETTNVIQFIYRQEANPVVLTQNSGASIGITAAGTGSGNFLSLNSSGASPTASSTTSTNNITTKPATNQIYTFTPLSCSAPTDLQKSNVTNNSATLSWNAVSGATGYEYVVSTSATDPANGTATTSTSVNIALTPGSVNYLHVRTNCGSSFSVWARTAIVPCTTNTSPANGATNVPNPPTIGWNAVPGATGYTIMFSTDGTTFFNIGTLGSTATSAEISNTSYSTTYYFYVRPVGGNDTAATACQSNATSFTTQAPPVPPTCTQIVTPPNGATNVSAPAATFTWRTAASADEYLFLFGTSSSNLDTLGSTADTTVQLSPLQYSTTYYWSIIPGNGGGYASNCQVNSFTTQAAPPPPPCAPIVSPANGATNVSAPSVTFTWRSVPSATQYMFLIGPSSSNLDTLGNVTDTTITLSPFAFATTYYWSIVPITGAVYASGCPVNSFTTTAAPAVPPNDNCTGAVSISAYAPVNGYTFSATESMPGEQCGTLQSGNPSIGGANDDVWYKFTASQAGAATITVSTPDADFDPVIMVYSGICGGLTNIACRDAGAEGDPETINLSGLTAGTTYYFRIYGYAAAGELGEGSFTITASGVALPVTITKFEGRRDDVKNILSWTTATEQNNKGFELQRSADGRNFSAISFILTKANNGNSSSALQYSYADATPLSGDNYYRLKQLDKDEKATYSSVVLLKGAKPASVRVSTVYPNPTASSLKLVVTAPSNDKVNLIVTDLAGKVVMQQAAQLITGDNNLSLDVKKLASGSYIIKAVCASGCESATSKFMKQ